MKIVFLGTSGMVPTKERNVQGIYLDYKGEGILLDCGEGTQRQIQLAGLNAQKIKIILISHWHGDHVGGLMGLLQTLGNFSSDEKVVKLFGPPGTKEYLDHLRQSCVFDAKIEVQVTEINPQGLETFYENEEYKIQAITLDHSIYCLGFRFEKKEKRRMNEKRLVELGVRGSLIGQLQKGESVKVGDREVQPQDVSQVEQAHAISFIFDTQVCEQCYTLAEQADVLVSEAVYKHDLELKAREYKHMTALQAGQVAAQGGAKQLILTHFSQRYKDVQELEEEAKTVFPEVISAFDLMKYEANF